MSEVIGLAFAVGLLFVVVVLLAASVDLRRRGIRFDWDTFGLVSSVLILITGALLAIWAGFK